jgi:hypothetical protein
MPDSHPRDFMGKKPLDLVTAEAWNGLVELVLSLEMRLEILERLVNNEEVGHAS